MGVEEANTFSSESGPSQTEGSAMVSSYLLVSSGNDSFSRGSRNDACAKLAHRNFHAGDYSPPSIFSMRCFTLVIKLFYSAKMLCFSIYGCGLSWSTSEGSYCRRCLSPLLGMSSGAPSSCSTIRKSEPNTPPFKHLIYFVYLLQLFHLPDHISTRLSKMG